MNLRKLLYIGLIFSLISCKTEYQKMLSSKDYEKQYEYAVSLFEQKSYYKAYTLFEQILPAFRLTEKAEKVNYYIARCYYEEGDYLMAAYYFERFVMSFPRSEIAEEAYYSSAVCYYEASGKPSLDQNYTDQSLKAFLGYVNKYPKGKFIQKSNEYIGLLRNKYEEKQFAISKQYYELSQYKAAVISFKNLLKDYPDAKNREEILYLIAASSFELTKNSVEDKKDERKDMALSDSKAYVDEYSKGKWIKDIENMQEQLQKIKITN